MMAQMVIVALDMVKKPIVVLMETVGVLDHIYWVVPTVALDRHAAADVIIPPTHVVIPSQQKRNVLLQMLTVVKTLIVSLIIF